MSKLLHSLFRDSRPPSISRRSLLRRNCRIASVFLYDLTLIGGRKDTKNFFVHLGKETVVQFFLDEIQFASLCSRGENISSSFPLSCLMGPIRTPLIEGGERNHCKSTEDRQRERTSSGEMEAERAGEHLSQEEDRKANDRRTSEVSQRMSINFDNELVKGRSLHSIIQWISIDLFTPSSR